VDAARLSEVKTEREAPRSKPLRLPSALRRKLEQALEDHRFTAADLMQFVNSRTEVPPPAIQFDAPDFERKLARYREAQEVAASWVTKLGQEPSGDVGRLLAEMLKTVAFKLLSGFGEDKAGAKPAEIVLLARAIKDLEIAGRTSAERELKIRAQLKMQLENHCDAMRAAGTGDLPTLEKAKELVRGLL
jgi:hypothetical protein